MPFKITPYRLEMIADFVFILGVIFSVILLFGFETILGSIIVLLAVFFFSYILYAAAKILRNTEEILERLDTLAEKEEEKNNED